MMGMMHRPMHPMMGRMGMMHHPMMGAMGGMGGMMGMAHPMMGGAGMMNPMMGGMGGMGMGHPMMGMNPMMNPMMAANPMMNGMGGMGSTGTTPAVTHVVHHFDVADSKKSGLRDKIDDTLRNIKRLDRVRGGQRRSGCNRHYGCGALLAQPLVMPQMAVPAPKSDPMHHCVFMGTALMCNGGTPMS